MFVCTGPGFTLFTRTCFGANSIMMEKISLHKNKNKIVNSWNKVNLMLNSGSNCLARPCSCNRLTYSVCIGCCVCSIRWQLCLFAQSNRARTVESKTSPTWRLCWRSSQSRLRWCFRTIETSICQRCLRVCLFYRTFLWSWIPSFCGNLAYLRHRPLSISWTNF